MPKQEKIERVEELREEVNKSKALLFTDYRGLKVSEMVALRRKLHEVDADYQVVKNTLFSRATEGITESGLEECLAGPTAVAFVHNDPVAPAKAIVDFMKEHKALTVKGGFVDGRVFNGDQIQQLSKVPPREVLLAQMIGAMQSPITGLVGSLQGLVSNLVYTLQAVADKKA